LKTKDLTAGRPMKPLAIDLKRLMARQGAAPRKFFVVECKKRELKFDIAACAWIKTPPAAATLGRIF
jgi:hypothetical protein